MKRLFILCMLLLVGEACTMDSPQSTPKVTIIFEDKNGVDQGDYILDISYLKFIKLLYDQYQDFNNPSQLRVSTEHVSFETFKEIYALLPFIAEIDQADDVCKNEKVKKLTHELYKKINTLFSILETAHFLNIPILFDTIIEILIHYLALNPDPLLPFYIKVAQLNDGIRNLIKDKISNRYILYHPALVHISRLKSLEQQASIELVRWSPDGSKILVVYCSQKGFIHIFDSSTGSYIATCNNAQHPRVAMWDRHPRAVSWSSDSTKIIACYEGTDIKIFEAQTGALLPSPSSSDYTALTVSWNPLDSRVASGSPDGTISIWQASPESNWQLLQQSSFGYRQPVFIEWSPDGKLLFIFFSDGTRVLVLWNTLTGTHQVLESENYFSISRDGKRYRVPGDILHVKSIHWHPHSTYFAAYISTGYRNGTCIYTVSDGKIKDFYDHCCALWGVDGSKIIVVDDRVISRVPGEIKEMKIIDFLTGQVLHHWDNKEPSSSIAMSPDGKKMVMRMGGYKDFFTLWDFTRSFELYQSIETMGQALLIKYLLDKHFQKKDITLDNDVISTILTQNQITLLEPILGKSIWTVQGMFAALKKKLAF